MLQESLVVATHTEALKLAELARVINLRHGRIYQVISQDKRGGSRLWSSVR